MFRKLVVTLALFCAVLAVRQHVIVMLVTQSIEDEYSAGGDDAPQSWTPEHLFEDLFD